MESQLEEFHFSQLAQVVRWLSFWNLPEDSQELGLTFSERMVLIDVKIRRILQREMYLVEETNALQKSVALEEAGDKNERATETAQIMEYESQLHDLNKEYWDFCRLSGEVEGELPARILRRAFKSCRADPEWYFCPWMRENCAKRGGCCG